MKKTDARILVEGDVYLDAWVFKPEGFSGPRPAITMAHGFGGLKYRSLENFAEKFAKAGFVVIVHDHRGFGLSGGQPRGDIDPWQQIADWRRVIAYLETLDEVDNERIGLWGASYAGGHVLVLAATDTRIKVVVSQVPTISGHEQGKRRLSAEARAEQQELFNEDERAQLRGEEPMVQKLHSLDPNVRAAYRSKAAIEFHDMFELPEGVEDNEYVTVRSTRKAQMYESGLWVPRISPKPLLMIVGDNDVITPTDLALGAYQQALEPKSLTIFKGGHYDGYVNRFDETSQAAEDWFIKYLQP